MVAQCVIARQVAVAAGVFAPGHLGELTRVVDFALVDAVAQETGTVQRRVRLLPTRVVVFFVLALGLFEGCGYRRVWSRLVAGLGGLAVGQPSASALMQARRRVGVRPLRALFEVLAGPVGRPGMAGVFWRGLRVLAVDGTTVYVPDAPGVAGWARRSTGRMGGYPLLRLSVLLECGTRSLVAATFSALADSELAHAARLVAGVGAGMLVLLDAGYDSRPLLAQIDARRGWYLCRSGARRTPLVLRELGDGSYLSVFGNSRDRVRVIEALVTVTCADGVVRAQAWRLITNLLDERRYPAGELVALYHRRWQVETGYAHLKCTILDGRVLRSHRPEDIAQEMYGLLTAYQAIVRVAMDALDELPTPPPPDRVSFTVAIDTARLRLITATGVLPTGNDHRTTIGAAVLAALLPKPRQRLQARMRKLPLPQYRNPTGQPLKTQHYTLQLDVKIFEEGLTARTQR